VDLAVQFVDGRVTDVTNVAGGRQDYARKKTERDYGLGTQIMLDFGISRMQLPTSSTRKLTALGGFGLEVTGRQSIRSKIKLLVEVQSEIAK